MVVTAHDIARVRRDHKIIEALVAEAGQASECLLCRMLLGPC